MFFDAYLVTRLLCSYGVVSRKNSFVSLGDTGIIDKTTRDVTEGKDKILLSTDAGSRIFITKFQVGMSKFVPACMYRKIFPFKQRKCSIFLLVVVCLCKTEARKSLKLSSLHC